MNAIPVDPPDASAGCPLGPDGWRFVVQTLYTETDPARVYGSRRYGSNVYGSDGTGDLTTEWNDITRPAYSATISRGTADGSPNVPVDRLVFELIDDAGEWVDFQSPPDPFRPAVGSIIRAGVLDPVGGWWPLAVGIVETLAAEHTEPPRLVTIEAYGVASDLAVSVPVWSPPAETGADRLARLLAAAAWRWEAPLWVADGAAPLLAAVGDPITVAGRVELDRTALSAVASIDTTPAGRLRVSPWPYTAAGDPVVIVDCVDGFTPPAPNAGVVESPRIGYRRDTAALLNSVYASNVDAATSLAVDPDSVDEHGRRTDLYGVFPAADLYAAGAGLDALTAAALARHARLVERVERVDADTLVDPAWFAVLAAVDVGDPVTVYRVELPNQLVDAATVVGIEHRIDRNRWRATINTINQPDW